MPTKNKAIILAAGQGKRLRPLTNRLPKCLLEVGGLPILHRQLQALRDNRVTSIILVVGFMAKKIEDYAIKNFPSLRFDFIYNPRFKTANNLYSLALAAEKTAPTDTVFQLNGDVIFDPQIIRLLRKTSPTRSYLGVKTGKCGREEMKISINPKGTINRLSKRLDPSESLGEEIGINRFSPRFWALLKDSLGRLKEPACDEYFEHAIERTIAQGGKVHPFSIGKLLAIEIDFLEDLKKAKRIVDCLSAGSVSLPPANIR